MPNLAKVILILLLLWPAAAVAANRLTVIVFPLDGSGASPSLAWVGEGIAVSISEQLDAATLKAIDRNERVKMVENLDLPPGAQLSMASMIRVGQRADADLIILGSYSGTEQNLKISLRVLDLRALKLGGEMVSNGPASALPQMENELAWLVLRNKGLDQGLTRAQFHERIRKVPNQAYAYYVQSFGAPSEDEQKSLLLKAVQIYRDFSDAQYRLGEIYFRSGDCAGALGHLSFASAGRSSHAAADFMRGTCFLQGNQHYQSIQAFQRLLQTFRPFEALNNLGVAYLRKGDFSSAQNALVEAKSLARTDSTVSLNLAIVRHLQGNDSAALPILDEAAKLHPRSGMLQFLIGVVLKSQGDTDKSALALAKAKSLGTDVEKLQSEDPKSWSRIFTSLESR